MCPVRLSVKHKQSKDKYPTPHQVLCPITESVCTQSQGCKHITGAVGGNIYLYTAYVYIR